MKFLCLIYHDEDELGALPQSEYDALVSESLALDEELKRTGRGIAAEALQSARTAATLRMRNGKTTITDGPFAETKEQVGGFFLIDAGSLEEAVGIAARIPGLRVGTVEVRPINDLRAP